MSSAGIHHIAVFVSDLEKMHKFYQSLPGLEWMEFQFDEEGKERSSWFRIGTSILMLELPHPQLNSEEINSFRNQKPFRVIFSALDSSGNLLPLHKWESVFTHRTDYTVYLLDPEGNSIGYSSYPRKLDFHIK